MLKKSSDSAGSDIYEDIGNRESKTFKSLIINNESEKDAKKSWKNESSSNTNKSTLSLHIEVYENLTEAIVSDSFGKNGLKKEGLIGKLDNIKQILTSSAFITQNLFEFPRQQNGKVLKPEVSQYKTSRQLINPNEPRSDEIQISENDIDSCKTAQLPDFIQRRKKKTIQKKDEFLLKLAEQPISKQKSIISTEIAKIERMRSKLTSTNAQHFITKKKLQKRAEILQSYVIKLHSPSTKTAELPPEYYEIPSPTTAISPNIERMEERINQIKIQLKQIKMNDLELIKEKLLIEQKLLQRFEKEVDAMGKEIKEMEEKSGKLVEEKIKMINAFEDCEIEQQNIKNDFKLYRPKIEKMERKCKQMQKLILRCDIVTTKLNSGESRLSWELWILSPFYNFCLWILFVWSLLRDEATKFLGVFMNDFKQKKLKK
uniref:Uncharacterized protein n=1 Tax=Panagrolaimus davidi TaxID=227884 RepID=A0A914Q7F3_9BILA